MTDGTKETRTDAFRRTLRRRMGKWPMPRWLKKIKGHGVYAIAGCSVVKGVVGEVVIRSAQMKRKDYEKCVCRPFPALRRETVILFRLFAPPFDVAQPWVFTPGGDDLDGYDRKHRYMDCGVIGLYGIDEIYRTRRDALEALKKRACQQEESE